ncbi:MAG TPA: LacI family DNA-binding transcriptional regulator [Rhodothermales bacterium]
MSATLNDIAAKAGVSVSTVSRVLNKKAKKYRISSETEERIVKAAKELSYRPNEIARGLRLKKTNTIGLIAPDVSNPFFAYIIKRVQSVAHGMGYSLIVCNTDENVDQEVSHVNLLFRNRVDGLIAMPVGTRYDHYADWIDKGLPLVLLDRCFDQLNVRSVVVDNYAGSYEAVEHLIGYGHERIAFIQGLPGTYTNSARLSGYRDALETHGLPYDPELVVGADFRQENGYMETKLLLSKPDRPTAIFATSDMITLGALQAIYEEGLSIPDDISIVMFDDVDFAPFLRCPLTAVRQPKELMGEMAVKMLVDEVRGERQGADRQGASRVMLKPRLVRRLSVAAPGGATDLVHVSSRPGVVQGGVRP